MPWGLDCFSCLGSPSRRLGYNLSLQKIMFFWKVKYSVHITCRHLLSKHFLFKGTVSRGGCFFKGLNILISTFLCMRWWFSRSFKLAFHYPIQLLTFYLLLWNYLLILKMLTETLLRIPIYVIGLCSLVPTSHRLQEKCAKINLLSVLFYRIRAR
jgi:hypothetical protein